MVYFTLSRSHTIPLCIFLSSVSFYIWFGLVLKQLHFIERKKNDDQNKRACRCWSNSTNHAYWSSDVLQTLTIIVRSKWLYSGWWCVNNNPTIYYTATDTNECYVEKIERSVDLLRFTYSSFQRFPFVSYAGKCIFSVDY